MCSTQKDFVVPSSALNGVKELNKLKNHYLEGFFSRPFFSMQQKLKRGRDMNSSDNGPSKYMKGDNFLSQASWKRIISKFKYIHEHVFMEMLFKNIYKNDPALIKVRNESTWILTNELAENVKMAKGSDIIATGKYDFIPPEWDLKYASEIQIMQPQVECQKLEVYGPILDCPWFPSVKEVTLHPGLWTNNQISRNELPRDHEYLFPSHFLETLQNLTRLKCHVNVVPTHSVSWEKYGFKCNTSYLQIFLKEISYYLATSGKMVTEQIGPVSTLIGILWRMFILLDQGLAASSSTFWANPVTGTYMLLAMSNFTKIVRPLWVAGGATLADKVLTVFDSIGEAWKNSLKTFGSTLNKRHYDVEIEGFSWIIQRYYDWLYWICGGSGTWMLVGLAGTFIVGGLVTWAAQKAFWKWVYPYMISKFEEWQRESYIESNGLAVLPGLTTLYIDGSGLEGVIERGTRYHTGTTVLYGRNNISTLGLSNFTDIGGVLDNNIASSIIDSGQLKTMSRRARDVENLYLDACNINKERESLLEMFSKVKRLALKNGFLSYEFLTSTFKKCMDLTVSNYTLKNKNGQEAGWLSAASQYPNLQSLTIDNSRIGSDDIRKLSSNLVVTLFRLRDGEDFENIIRELAKRVKKVQFYKSERQVIPVGLLRDYSDIIVQKDEEYILNKK
jgi:hypothetical protein